MRHPVDYILASIGIATVAAFVGMVATLAFYAIDGDWFATCALVCLLGVTASLMWPGKPFTNETTPSEQYARRMNRR